MCVKINVLIANVFERERALNMLVDGSLSIITTTQLIERERGRSTIDDFVCFVLFRAPPLPHFVLDENASSPT
jgi:hypothetical protein